MSQPVITEQWRKIPGFKEIYEVSNLGEVRSWGQLAKGRVLSARPHSVTGLPEVKVVRDGAKKRRAEYVHILVARAFPEEET
ncbi:NUMOD4 domain-containing protein [Streptomyces collinus]|uniref:NUMOD4 domain-containing protein n=1 Tax=Streptomyces collinus TaxID=42684 RepID=UPI00378BC51E